MWNLQSYPYNSFERKNVTFLGDRDSQTSRIKAPDLHSMHRMMFKEICSDRDQRVTAKPNAT